VLFEWGKTAVLPSHVPPLNQGKWLCCLQTQIQCTKFRKFLIKISLKLDSSYTLSPKSLLSVFTLPYQFPRSNFKTIYLLYVPESQMVSALEFPMEPTANFSNALLVIGWSRDCRHRSSTQVSNHIRFQPITDKMTLIEYPTHRSWPNIYVRKQNICHKYETSTTEQSMKDQMGGVRYSSTPLFTSKLDGSGWLRPRPVHFIAGTRPGIHRERNEPKRIRNNRSTPVARQSFIINAHGQHTTSPPPPPPSLLPLLLLLLKYWNGTVKLRGHTFHKTLYDLTCFRA
jgi:hypothetical protein